jgi:hypothetical protein
MAAGGNVPGIAWYVMSDCLRHRAQVSGAADKCVRQAGEVFRIVKVLRLMGNGSAKDGDSGFQVL